MLKFYLLAGRCGHSATNEGSVWGRQSFLLKHRVHKGSVSQVEIKPLCPRLAFHRPGRTGWEGFLTPMQVDMIPGGRACDYSADQLSLRGDSEMRRRVRCSSVANRPRNSPNTDIGRVNLYTGFLQSLPVCIASEGWLFTSARPLMKQSHSGATGDTMIDIQNGKDERNWHESEIQMLQFAF